MNNAFVNANIKIINKFSNKDFFVILLLIFVFPLGFILMWFWISWPKWVKLLISAPILLAIAGIIFAAVVNRIAPKDRQIRQQPGFVNSLPNVNKYQATQSQAKDSQVKSDFNTIKRILALYKKDKGAYPTVLQQLQAAGYITSLPQSPYSDKQYNYQSTGTSYTLSTTLGDGNTYQVAP